MEPKFEFEGPLYKFKGHEFNYFHVLGHSNSFKCNICGIIFLSKFDGTYLAEVVYETYSASAKYVINKYLLTCDEYIIKNIIE